MGPSSQELQGEIASTGTCREGEKDHRYIPKNKTKQNLRAGVRLGGKAGGVSSKRCPGELPKPGPAHVQRIKIWLRDHLAHSGHCPINGVSIEIYRS